MLQLGGNLGLAVTRFVRCLLFQVDFLVSSVSALSPFLLLGLVGGDALSG